MSKVTSSTLLRYFTGILFNISITVSAFVPLIIATKIPFYPKVALLVSMV
jgi:hypothetical protein